MVELEDGKETLPAAKTLASEMAGEWPSAVYEKIVAVIEKQAGIVAPLCAI